MAAPNSDHGTSPQYQFSKKGWSQDSDSPLKVCDIWHRIKLFNNPLFEGWPTDYHPSHSGNLYYSNKEIFITHTHGKIQTLIPTLVSRIFQSFQECMWWKFFVRINIYHSDECDSTIFIKTSALPRGFRFWLSCILDYHLIVWWSRQWSLLWSGKFGACRSINAGVVSGQTRPQTLLKL